MSRDYLTTADVLGIHALMLKKYGGTSGVKDMGALEAALFRPQSGYYTDIVQEVCALMESLLINHPFVDGNKRTAFAACDVFLRINGSRFRASPEEMYRLIVSWIESPSTSRWRKIEEDMKRIVQIDSEFLL